jgi:biopolymer transport protein ExbB
MNIVERSKDLMLAMGAAPIMYLLIGLSIASFALVIERMWFFLRIDDDVPALALRLRSLLGEGDLEGARRCMGESPSPAAAIVLAGLEEATNGADSAEEAMHGALATQRARLERRLAFLGTLGNNAPFLGLFGTVVGIVMAFERLGEAGRSSGAAGAGATNAVMSSIAEALVATAVGLLVALPAVAAYNFFQGRITSVLGGSDTLSRVLLAWLKSIQRGGRPDRVAVPAEPPRESVRAHSRARIASVPSVPSVASREV